LEGGVRSCTRKREEKERKSRQHFKQPDIRGKGYWVQIKKRTAYREESAPVNSEKWGFTDKKRNVGRKYGTSSRGSA